MTKTEKANQILLAIYKELKDGDLYEEIDKIMKWVEREPLRKHKFSIQLAEIEPEYFEFCKLMVQLVNDGFIKAQILEAGLIKVGNILLSSSNFRKIQITEKGKQKCESLKENVDLITKDRKQNKMKEPKIFISHSSKDEEIVGKVIEILEAIGVPSGKIFCSSFEGYGVKLGEDFLERIKKELDNDVMVLFILTSNFYTSPISLCEMGASWVKTNKQILVLIPPFRYEEIKGVFPTLQSMKINEQSKLNSLKDVVAEFIGLETLNTSIWERKRNKILKEINEILHPSSPNLTMLIGFCLCCFSILQGMLQQAIY